MDDCGAIVVDAAHPREKFFRVLRQTENVMQQRPVAGVGLNLGRHMEQLDEPLVHEDADPVLVHHQDAVECRVRLRFKKCGLGSQVDLGLLAARDIGEHAVGQQPAVLLVSSDGPVMNPDPASVFVLKTKLDVERLLIGKECVHRLLKLREILRMDADHKHLHSAGANLFAGVTQHGDDLGTDVEHATVLIGGPGDVGHVREQAAELRFAPGQRAAGPARGFVRGTHPGGSQGAQKERHHVNARPGDKTQRIVRPEEEIAENQRRGKSGEEPG